MKGFYALVVPLDPAPEPPGHPEHPIAIDPVYPSQLPSVGGGRPSQPIYIPDVPAHPIATPPGSPSHPIVIPEPPPGIPVHPIALPPGPEPHFIFLPGFGVVMVITGVGGGPK